MIAKILKSELIKNKQGKRLTRTTFLCSCGKTHSAWQKDINYGTVRSCGCAVKTDHYKTHGLSKTKTYSSWLAMKARCNNKNTPFYKNYGGRAISYDKKWESFSQFYKDMGDCPLGYSLDRIDNNKNYHKENCRWASSKQQMRNTSRNVFIKYKGKNRTLAEISDLTGLSQKMLSKRLKRGWSEYDTVNLIPLKNQWDKKKIKSN